MSTQLLEDLPPTTLSERRDGIFLPEYHAAPWTAEFRGFPKIPRFKRNYVITEKIDGTNACVIIGPDGQVAAQSRKRIITPEADNFGFARWVKDNEDELRELGEGYHFGEWFGSGIQRNYGLDYKVFALFNTGRWQSGYDDDGSGREFAPNCCGVVPVLWQGHDNLDHDIMTTLEYLRVHGSRAVPGFKPAEGIVVYHSAAGSYFKILLENDEIPKGAE